MSGDSLYERRSPFRLTLLLTGLGVARRLWKSLEPPGGLRCLILGGPTAALPGPNEATS